MSRYHLPLSPMLSHAVNVRDEISAEIRMDLCK